MKNSKPLVLVLMGSDSDWPAMSETLKALDGFGIEAEVAIASAHRSPARTTKMVSTAAARGIEVIVAGAGAAAHLAGMCAAETILPVIGVPLATSPLAGFDALLAISQMPAGVPVATMAVGPSGARNAGVLAAQILALSRPPLQKKLADYKHTLADGVMKKDQELAELLRRQRASRG